MCCVMADVFSLPKEHIKPDLSAANVTDGPNIRPKDVQLDTGYSFETVDFEPVMRFDETIKDCLENFVD